MAEVGTAAAQLVTATAKNEKEIVIEFSTDRILMYVGVFLVAAIAAVAKVSQLAASSLTCYPSGESTASADLIKYANEFCWESSSSEASSPKACNKSETTTTMLIQNPAVFKIIFRSLPYVMVVEAMLFALPATYWHTRVGSKLLGHLKFMRNLLTEMYHTVKKVPRGIYCSNESYDSHSYYLDDMNGFDPDYKPSLRRRSTKEKHIPFKQNGRKPNKEGRWNDFLFRDMRDRHLFSMLCFENFSSIEHHPYILSMYKLTVYDEQNPFAGGTFPKLKAMVRLMCQPNNFGGTVLVATYFWRHAIGAAISLIFSIAMCAILVWIGSTGWYAESFRCAIPYYGTICMTCTVIRRLDMIAYVAINLTICVLYFIISVSRVMYVRGSSERAVCHYFEEISDTGSVALWDDDES